MSNTASKQISGCACEQKVYCPVHETFQWNWKESSGEKAHEIIGEKVVREIIGEETERENRKQERLELERREEALWELIGEKR